MVAPPWSTVGMTTGVVLRVTGCTGGSGTAGSATLTVVPRPGLLLSQTVPPDCEMIPYTIASPSPVPLPGGLVVKKGSNARATAAASMPTPVSVTEISTIESDSRSGGSVVREAISDTGTTRLLTTSTPPCGIAS